MLLVVCRWRKWSSSGRTLRTVHHDNTDRIHNNPILYLFTVANHRRWHGAPAGVPRELAVLLRPQGSTLLIHGRKPPEGSTALLRPQGSTLTYPDRQRNY